MNSKYALLNFPVKDFFIKCDQIRSFLRIWSHLLKKSLMENFIFCAVQHHQKAFQSDMKIIRFFPLHWDCYRMDSDHHYSDCYLYV